MNPKRFFNVEFNGFDESIDATGKSLYKITYNTELDGLLGPITFYVDKMSGIVIGADYRE